MFTDTASGATTIKRIHRLGLVENPFLTYPDGRYFFPCNEHQTLYQEVLRIIAEKRKRGIALIRGEAGTGKSILAKRLAGVPMPDNDLRATGILLKGPINTPTALVRQVNAALDLPTERTYEGRMELLHNLVERMSIDGNSLFLAIDSPIKSDVVGAVLEMAGWQIEEQHAVQTAIFSSDNVFFLEEKQPSLTQHVGFRSTLGPITWRSASDMIEARVRMAGRIAPLFTDDALDTLIEVARGIPGDLMRIANRALQILIHNNEDIITETIVLMATE